MSLEWMAWTVPTAVFFICVFTMLVAMTVWQIVSPAVERRGLLPLRTTRGDRLFIGLLGSGFIHLAWLAFTSASVWWALPMAAVWMIVIMIWG